MKVPRIDAIWLVLDVIDGNFLVRRMWHGRLQQRRMRNYASLFLRGARLGVGHAENSRGHNANAESNAFGHVQPPHGAIPCESGAGPRPRRSRAASHVDARAVVLQTPLT